MGAVWSLITLPFRTTIATISAVLSVILFFIRLTWTIASLTHLISYMFYVSFTTFALAATYEKEIPMVLNKFFPTRYQRLPTTLMVSVIAEAPHYIIVLKVTSILFARFFGVFNYWLGWMFLLVDVLNIATLVFFYSEGLTAVGEMVKQAPASDKNNPEFTVSSMVQKSVPFVYRSKKQINIYRNVQYYTLDDMRDPSISSINLHDEGILDVYTTGTTLESTLRPVVINAHGGGWTHGSKDQPCPLVRILAERGFVVCNVNYRLAPKAPQPAGLQDVQKAIQWARDNISAFGGDPSSIVLSGDSAGAHLALLATVTAERPVQGAILVCGSLDVSNEFGLDQSKGDRFRDIVCGGDASVVKQLSALSHITEGKAIPPILAFHAEHDCLANYEDSKRVCAKVRGFGNKADLITVTGTQHAFMIFNSPRTIAMSQIAADWALKLYSDKKKSQ